MRGRPRGGNPRPTHRPHRSAASDGPPERGPCGSWHVRWRVDIGLRVRHGSLGCSPNKDILPRRKEAAVRNLRCVGTESQTESHQCAERPTVAAVEMEPASTPKRSRSRERSCSAVALENDAAQRQGFRGGGTATSATPGPVPARSRPVACGSARCAGTASTAARHGPVRPGCSPPPLAVRARRRPGPRLRGGSRS